VGAIANSWLSEQMKIEILHVIERSLQQGVSVRRSCLILSIEHRRIVRWKLRARLGRGLGNQKPGPKDALHRILPEEVQRIVTMAQSQKYVDLSHRMMAVTAWDQDIFQASFTTVYRVLKARGMTSMRGPGGAHNGRSKPPVRKILCAPNQRWCWDISYLLTQQKGTYLFLYLLLDEWSRKVIQWRISWSQSTEEARLLLEGGLIEQSILDKAEDQRPEVLNDRGRQMKAKTIQKLCEEHAMPQLFSRPRTPNDNPFIESAFSTLKRAPEYPGRFLDDAEALTYFSRYFAWYDTEHYHSGIDYVTPQQAHSGLRPQIVKDRRAKMLSQRRHRRAENKRRKPISANTNETNKVTANLVA
jgi:putative transposase